MVPEGGEQSLFYRLSCLRTGSLDQLADFQFMATASDNFGQPLIGTSVCEVTSLITIFPGFLHTCNKFAQWYPWNIVCKYNIHSKNLEKNGEVLYLH